MDVVIGVAVRVERTRTQDYTSSVSRAGGERRGREGKGGEGKKGGKYWLSSF